MNRLFQKDGIRQKQLEIQESRIGLEEFSVSLGDLNRKIERMEKIATKWKERGDIFDKQV